MSVIVSEAICLATSLYINGFASEAVYGIKFNEDYFSTNAGALTIELKKFLISTG
jgi:hypothetical protein